MESSVYERLGARAVVNCRGVYSELGGAIIGPKVWDAMTEANRSAASMSELLDATGSRLASLLGAEAGRVTPGAAAAIALGTAACLTRGDGAASERLPDTTGLPGEVILQRTQLPHYKYARVIRMAGAQLRLVDSRDELEQALDPKRVAAVFVPAHLDEQPGALPLEDVAAVARERGIPTLVDAAFLNYPPEGMRRFTEEGADLVCFSAKYCYGPNTGGFVVGRADLVDAVAQVDFTNFETGRWAKFGRPFKLDLHTVVGTTLAVEEWFELDHEARWRSYAELVDRLARAVEDIPGVRTERRFFTMVETLEDEPVNCLVLHVDAAAEVERALYEANPRVAVHRHDDTLIVAVDTLLPSQCQHVCTQLRAGLMSIL
jgi:D-glucosaminate-6-phosphate ammonia-lyase